MDLKHQMIYPLVNIQKAIENGPVEIVDFPMKNGDFPLQNVSSPNDIGKGYLISILSTNIPISLI